LPKREKCLQGQILTVGSGPKTQHVWCNKKKKTTSKRDQKNIKLHQNRSSQAKTRLRGRLHAKKKERTPRRNPKAKNNKPGKCGRKKGRQGKSRTSGSGKRGPKGGKKYWQNRNKKKE